MWHVFIMNHVKAHAVSVSVGDPSTCGHCLYTKRHTCQARFLLRIAYVTYFCGLTHFNAHASCELKHASRASLDNHSCDTTPRTQRHLQSTATFGTGKHEAP